jgi:glycosyltransferase involved in cell wall biosynthesis
MQKRGDAAVHSDGELNLYHLGNNHLHRDIYDRALARPGVAVIHDAVLHHFFLGSLSETAYVEEFTFNYGGWSADLARSLWQDRSRSATDPRFFKYPMLKRVVEASRAVIVHNPAAAALVRQHGGSRIVEIPHLFEAPVLPACYEIESLRRELGCSGETLLFGVFGHLRESKRLMSVIRAFERIRGECDVRLLVAGEFASSDLARAVTPLRGAPGIVWRGYLPEVDFWRYASAVDVGVNLRYPAAGETSGIAIRLMGIGKPVIVTEGAETSGFPPGTCLRAESGAAEVESLAAYLRWLSGSRSAREAMGREAARHIRQEHDLPGIARRYWSVLQDCYAESIPIRTSIVVR